MELNDITEIFRKNQGKPIEINSQNIVDILSYLKEKGIKETVAKYKLDLFKYPTYFSYAKIPIEELISVIKHHISDGTGVIQRYEDKVSKYKINLEGSLGKVSGILCRDKMEIIFDRV